MFSVSVFFILVFQNHLWVLFLIDFWQQVEEQKSKEIYEKIYVETK